MISRSKVRNEVLLSKRITRREYCGNTARLCLIAGLPTVFWGCSKKEASSNKKKIAVDQHGNATASLETVTALNDYNNKASDFKPAYLELHRKGELKKRADELWAIMENCRLCPRKCGVNRLKGTRGFCRAPGAKLLVSSFLSHFCEEKPLVGKGGSGTIFLTYCNLRCVFCQNYEISQLGRGSETSIEELAGMMLTLQNEGCHNINFVTPTHYSAVILKALDIAAGKGLWLPIVYNTSGWERIEILKVLDGIVDIYLPDFKYWDSTRSAKYSSGAESYPDIARKAILEMHRQVGVVKPTKDNIVQRGLMIRHLVMPNNTSGSERIMEWIGDNLPKDTYVNIMAQYTPIYKAFDYPEMSRRITKEEYEGVVNKAREMGLRNLNIDG